MFGSVIVDELREGGFEGVACIITADQDDLQSLSRATGVNLAVAKSVELHSLAKQLRKMVQKRRPPSPTGMMAGGGSRLPHPLKNGSPHLAAILPSTSSPLIDLSHFVGMGTESLRAVLQLAYDRTPRHVDGALAASLMELQDSFTDGAECDRAAHNLFGAARTAGAALLGQEIKAFRAKPTAAALEAMWATLDVTRRKMREDGYLSPAATR